MRTPWASIRETHLVGRSCMVTRLTLRPSPARTRRLNPPALRILADRRIPSGAPVDSIKLALGIGLQMPRRTLNWLRIDAVVYWFLSPWLHRQKNQPCVSPLSAASIGWL
jgi:hypothetical protein